MPTTIVTHQYAEKSEADFQRELDQYEAMLADKAERITKDIAERGIGRVLAEILDNPLLYRARP